MYLIKINRNLSVSESFNNGDVYFNPDNKNFYMWFDNNSYKIPEEVQELKNLINNSHLVTRKKQYYSDDENKLWNYYMPKERCSCKANVYHYEYDGKKIYGVCNACGEDVYILKDEYVEETLNKGIWK